MYRITAILFVLVSASAWSQSEIKTDQGFLFTPQYGFHTPGADLKERFNTFSALGLGVDYKFKSNFSIGVNYEWMFANNIKNTSPFSSITSTSGQVIDQNGDFSQIRLNMKGHLATLNLGYLINLPSDEPNSGLLIQVGGGFLQHRIDIVSSQVTIPQVNGDYEFGYDKMTYGFATTQYIGYQYLVEKNRYHFRLGVAFNQGFTEGRRTWDFNTNSSGLDKRFDTTVALKASLIVPVYTKSAKEEKFFID